MAEALLLLAVVFCAVGGGGCDPAPGCSAGQQCARSQTQSDVCRATCAADGGTCPGDEVCTRTSGCCTGTGCAAILVYVCCAPSGC